MKCPFRRIVTHKPASFSEYRMTYEQEIEDFAECYERECPCYDYINKECRRIKKQT